MLIGTYVKDGSYVAVGVVATQAERAAVVLERFDRPGQRPVRVECEMESVAQALRHAEGFVFSRAGLLGAAAEGLAGSPVERGLARSMFGPRLGRFVHMPAGPRAGG